MRGERSDVRADVGVTVLGVGNTLAGDDGVGPALAEALAAADLPPGTRIRAAGSDPLTLLEEIEAGRTVLLVDACRSGGRPGTVRWMRLDDPRWPEVAAPLSLHGLDLHSVFPLARTLGLPLDRAWLMGIEPGAVAPAEGLSEPVRAAWPRLVAAAQHAVALLSDGHPLRDPASAPARDAADSQGAE